jgi:GT2 family glycosyltransferase
MSIRPIISFSIVSHGSGKLIKNLLKDIRETCKINYEVILTINISEKLDYLEPYADMPIKKIVNRRVKGFAANNNHAFKFSNGDYFLVINPDIRLGDFNFELFLKNFDKKNVAVCGPKIIHSSGKVEDSPRKFPTIKRLIKRRILNGDQIDYSFNDKPISVDWVGGMFMMFPSKIFHNIGGFNEEFFMYMEDAEICREANRRSLYVIFNPTFSVIHLGQRKNRKELKYLLFHIKSLLIFLLKRRR